MILSYNTPRIYSKTCGCYASQEGFFFCPLHAAAPQLLEALKNDAIGLANMAAMLDPVETEDRMTSVYAAIAAASPDSYQAEPEEHNG